jgi:orotate phosphoribosyltransferase
LATATVDKLAELEPKKFANICYYFDRKEAKDHGEGGTIVGAPLRGKKVLVIDNVVTAGTTRREAIDKTQKEGGYGCWYHGALDRMEKLPPPSGDDSAPMPSAIGEIRGEYSIHVLSTLTLNNIIGCLKGLGSSEDIKRLEDYRTSYRAAE